MKNTSPKFSLPFKAILYGNNSFIVETDTSRYRLSAGISEHYILMNLSGSCKTHGLLIVELNEQNGKPALLPVAVRKGEAVTWIATVPDKNTDCPHLSDSLLLESHKVDYGEEYPDGFIDPSRTSLSYDELMDMEKILHSSDYVVEFYRSYRKRHPGTPLYDARLHYYMVKGIRKHKHYTDDFITPCDDTSFYLDWHDPFPWYLYSKTFGGINTWPSHAKIRLMADNGCYPGIPLALKVIKSGKANAKIMHYAIVLAGMDATNDEVVSSYKEAHPRAVARVLYERNSPELYPMLLENAQRILAGMNNDILDDFPVEYSTAYDRLEEYTINHRGFIRLDTLSEEQVRGLWEIYRQLAQQFNKAKKEEECFRLGNAFRAFLLALIYNQTPAVGEILDDIYRNFNTLLYTEWAEDSKYRQMDIMWMNYLYRLVLEWDILDNFWSWLQHYAQRYDHYLLSGNQRFFLMIYAKVAYRVVDPATFYDALAPLIDINYVLVEDRWPGVTENEYLDDNDPPLDHRWHNMFCDYNYYVWTDKAQFYYQLIKHKIAPHPAGWNGKWQPGKKKLKIIVPR